MIQFKKHSFNLISLQLNVNILQHMIIFGFKITLHFFCFKNTASSPFYYVECSSYGVCLLFPPDSGYVVLYESLGILWIWSLNFFLFKKQLTNIIKALFIFECFLFSEWNSKSTVCNLRAHRWQRAVNCAYFGYPLLLVLVQCDICANF